MSWPRWRTISQRWISCLVGCHSQCAHHEQRGWQARCPTRLCSNPRRRLSLCPLHRDFCCRGRADEKKKHCSSTQRCQPAPSLDDWRSRPFSAETFKSGVVTRFSSCAARVRMRCRLPCSRQTSAPTGTASV
ncbi:conserved hypothetical protein [Leishmania mexicana MHOM/GT/2001/U1103]|uniref:Uncharacterized protein n=1 Tax=Leishmania mexicana (strain MHOM/GT/2001/U1103) TaxID=929439 RepID=E9AZ35_LEIMU|nr:conserved hypothetical protein [Leishmania mexicana MHOM/GT/2001/U1103]CBZ28232.1 conserved hypothetical protein [Leishmania mexicana MHOM/GT/2001/U1103]